MSNPHVTMVATVGGQELVIGQCLPAQARILTKKGHGKLVDGKLQVAIRPVHLAVAVNTVVEGSDDPNVSNAELERRLDWLRTIMNAVVKSETHGSDLDAILGYTQGVLDGLTNPRSGLAHLDVEMQLALRKMEVLRETLGRDQFRVTLSGIKGEDIVEDGVVREFVPLTDEEADAYYDDTDDPHEGHSPHGPSHDDLVALWRTAPDLSHAFGPSNSMGGTPALAFWPGPAIDQESAVYDLADLQAKDGYRVLPVRFVFNDRLDQGKVGKRGYPPRPCPTCGVGIDDDGDGLCGVCGPLLRPSRNERR